MKKIITLILIAVTFNFAMTLAESRSEVNHCHTRFEKVIDVLKNCKAPTNTTGTIGSNIFNCSNGEFYVGHGLEYAAVKINNIEVAIKYENGYGTPRYCMQITRDEFGVITSKETLHYYNEDAARVYDYFKSNVKVKKDKNK